MSEEAVAGAEGRHRRAPRRGDTPFDRALREMRERGSLLRVTGLRGASQRVAASHLIRAHGDRPVLYITADSRAADAAKEALQGLLGEREGESRIRSFPRHDTLPFALCNEHCNSSGSQLSPRPGTVRSGQARLGA